MSVEVLMPVVTAAGEEAVITAWFVDEGQACVAGQLIAEVQAEKTAVDLEAPAAGYVVDRVALGDPVLQDTPVCRIVESIEDTAAPSSTTPEQSEPRDGSQRVKASPSAKRVAKELGVDLTTISGTGPGGRITEEDVRSAGTAAPSRMSGLRAVIARNMRQSHAETAPVTLFSTVELGDRLPGSLTALIVKTVAEVLADHPHLNGRRDGDAFTPAATADISVAVQTEQGLVAPVVREPAARSVEEVNEEIADLAGQAGNRTLEVSDYEGGTFTVTNLGSYGIDGFTPIINVGQVAILGVGAARQVPVVSADGAVSVGYQMVLSLTFDHAFVDGAPAAAFLKQLVAALAGG